MEILLARQRPGILWGILIEIPGVCQEDEDADNVVQLRGNCKAIQTLLACLGRATP